MAVILAGWNAPAAAVAQSEKVDHNSVIPIGQIAGGNGGQPISANLVKAGDSSRRTKQEAIEQLPTEHLTPAGKQHVQQVLKDLSLFRRLPTLEVEVDRRTYNYFTDHPDVAVSIWRALDISSVQMKEINSQHYQTDTSDGTVGTVDVLLRSPGSYLVLCQGQLQSPGMPKPIHAKALMHLQPRFDNTGKVVHHLDLFVCFPSAAVETIAKLISPVSFRIADRNFEEVTLFMALMSSAMSRQPGWVEQTASRLQGVAPERPQELLKVTAAVYVDAERRRLTALGEPVTPESIRPPVTRTATAPQSGTAR
ncbi:hypothetical protein SH661x_001429 [Planctomicrobium sp. SH661]|uniref:hypothetical protein n=1 Tax=Planctomicrobium sp. SH661 TaxID=3448124 RepID=UPI003F5B5C03